MSKASKARSDRRRGAVWAAGLAVVFCLALSAPGLTAKAQQAPAKPGELDEAFQDYILEPWTGDFEGMVERGFVRLLTVHNPIYFTYDGVERRGLVVEFARALERHLAKAVGRKRSTLNVIVIPVTRDNLLPYLVAGKGDLVAANLTVTRARQAQVDFTDPIYPGVNELVVTGPGAPPVKSLEDLTATELHIRPSSSYFEHLKSLNLGRKQAGRPVIPLVPADERLEDHDLLEMVNAGLIPAVVVDSHKAALWAQVFDKIAVHEDLAIHRDGNIAWALRKDSPRFKTLLNRFVRSTRKGTLLGNVLLERYLGNPQWIDDIRNGKARQHYEETVAHIRKYAEAYDFDWQMIAAQGYQESKLDQSKRSAAGAVGVMQVLPSTAADPHVAIEGIERVGPNVHAGVKYLRHLKDRYFSDPAIAPLDQGLFAFAAYNAGARSIARARRKAVKMGLDPNRWFGHVEVAAARTISREPVIYVRNIYKYYIAYQRIAAMEEAKRAAVE